MKPLPSRITHHASRPLPPTSYFLLLAILLLAAGLRFYRLDAQSFWNDEGNSARIAERTLDLILEGAEGDIHPPGYYLLLHYWRALFGQSEFALRSLSAASGVALVACTYLLGRRLFGEPTGLAAALLGAISPFAVYYSQEVRMYAPLAALSAASTLLAIHKLQSLIPNTQYPIATHNPRPTLHFIAYVLTSAAGLYTHYAFPFVLLVHNAIFVLRWLTRARRSAQRWRWLALWAGTQAAVGVLYLPWLPIALRSVTSWPAIGQPYQIGPALLHVFQILTVGTTLPVEEAGAALASAGVLLLVGLWPTRGSAGEKSPHTDGASWFGVASLALYLFLPIALMFALDLYKSTWLKFLVVVLPPFHILAAHGLTTLIRAGTHKKHPISNTQYLIPSILLLGTHLIATYSSLRNLYFSPEYARDDYRQIAADIAALARPGDGIVLNAPNQWEVFTYYYPDQDVHPAPYRPGLDRVETFFAPLVERYRRLFVLYWGNAESDPQGRIEGWLASHAYKVGDRWYGQVRLATYGIAPLPREPAVALDVRFGEAVRLNGYALPDDRFGPGDVLPVTLFWEAEAPIAERYKVTVQLLDGAGQLVAQHDAEPGDGLAPTTTWSPGQVLADRHGVSLPPDLPPGRYALIVGLYHIASGERLPISSSFDHVALCDIQVQ